MSAKSVLHVPISSMAMWPDVIDASPQWNRTGEPRVHRRYVPERGECRVEGFDDGVDEALDGEWYSYAPPTWYLSCGHRVEGSEQPNFCPTCGYKVV